VAEVRFSARALRSLRGIERYLGERNPAAAERVVEEIGRACALIGDYPEMGPAIPGTRLRRHVTRRYRYRVIYRIVGDIVEIREVMHPARGGAVGST
jgi:plasmid stabilization system protein ParE